MTGRHPTAGEWRQALGRVAISLASVVTSSLAWGQGAPYAHTQPVHVTGANSARLHGFATPNGLPSVAWFEWGTNAAMGNVTAATDLGGGSNVVWVSASIEGISVTDLHHCRLVVSNELGVAWGGQRLFATQCHVLGWGTNATTQLAGVAGLGDVVQIAAGADHTLALRQDGTVAASGNNSGGKATVPGGLTDVVAVAAGSSHSLALKEDGTVVQWASATPVPAAATNVVALAAGRSLWVYTLALRKDGTLVHWGHASVAPPAGLSNLVEVAAASTYAVGLRADGTLVTWGLGGPTISAGVSNVVTVIAGASSIIAVHANGTITQWGGSQPPPGITNVIAAAAYAQNVVLRQDHTVTQWSNFPFPPAPAGLSEVVAVTAGHGYNLVLQPSPARPYAFTQPAAPAGRGGRTLRGTVTPNGLPTLAWFEWGTNGTYQQASTPVSTGAGYSVAHLSQPISDLVSGELYQFHVVASNALGMAEARPRLAGVHGHHVGCGDDAYGQRTFYPARQLDVMVAAGRFNSLGLGDDGQVEATGWFTVGSWPATPWATSWAWVPPGLSNVAGIAAGSGHGLVVTGDGEIVLWSEPWMFEASANSPTNVPAGLSDVVAVAAGDRHSVALRQNGTVAVWGGGNPRITNAPTGLSDVVAIAAGLSHNLALRHDGTVVAWGENTAGTTNVPAGLSDVVAVAAGHFHNVVLRADGTVLAWGSNTYGQTNVPAGLSNVVAVAAGLYHTIALRQDGAVVLWGRNDQGQTNISPTLAPSVSIAGGETHSMATTIRPALPLAAMPWAALIGSTHARLEGFATPNGLSSAAWFEWGLRGAGYPHGSTPAAVGDGGVVVHQSVHVADLQPDSVYQCQLVVSNEAGVARSHPHYFTTGRRVTAWGLNDSGQVSVPPGLSNVVGLAAGDRHSLALTSDGDVAGWGLNNFGQAVAPPGLGQVAQLAAGRDHSLALLADGTVVAWGGNDHGQTNVPAGLSQVVRISARTSQSGALKADGTHVWWGGPGAPAEVTASRATNLTSLTHGFMGALALRNDGLVFRSAFGPADRLPASNHVAVAAGMFLLAGLTADGSITRGTFTPNPPAGLSNAVSVAAASYTLLAVTAGGDIVAWAGSPHGELNIPSGLTDVVSVAAGYGHILALGPDVPYVINSGSVTGYVNTDLVIALPAHDPNGDPLEFRIASLPGAGALFQYASGGRGAPILAPDTAVTDPGNRVMFASVPDALGSPYTAFDFLVNDGVADSPSATVTVHVILPSAPQLDALTSGWSTETPGAFQLQFSGSSNATYSAYGSTNLMDWDRLGYAEAIAPGVFWFLDTEGAGHPQRYYRVGAP